MVKEIKFVILTLLAIIITIINAFTIFAQECDGTLNHPDEVVLGELFNVSFFFFNAPGWEGTAELIWNPVDGLINLSQNPTNTSPFTVWTMNSTKPGNYNISVLVTNASNNATCTKSSSILVVTSGRPFLLMNIILPQLNAIIAKSNVVFSVNVSNVGNETAKNVTTYFIDQNISPPSKYLGDIENGTSRIENYTLTPILCGKNVIEGKTQYNEYYFANDSEEFDVYGADLIIESFTLSDNNVYEGETVRFNVKVRNVGRNYVINASNVVVKIYRGNSQIAIINLGSVRVNESKSGFVEWEASGSSFLPKAVVDSAEECGNWQNNEAYGSYLTIRKKEEAGGGGGGGGRGEENKTYVCGNGICETQLGENSTNCPQDCKAIIPEIKPREEFIEISSDDGLVIVKLNKRTVIKDREGNRVNLSEIKIEKVKDISLVPYLPPGLYLVRAYKFTPEVTFDIPAQVTFKYNEEIPNEASLFIYRFVGDWEKVEAVWDKENKRLITQTYGFSIYALVTNKPLMPIITGAAIGFGEWIKTNWWIIAIIALIILILILAAIYTKKRK
jgi:hypothetical protein